MASPEECLDQIIAGGISVRTRASDRQNKGARGTKWHAGIEEAVPPLRIARRHWGQLLAATDSGRSRWDDHVGRIAVLLDDISLDEALQIAARSLELGLDDSFHVTDWTRSEEGRDDTSKSSFGGLDDDDDGASIDSEIRHLPGLQVGLFEELDEVDRLATIHRQGGDSPVFQVYTKAWEKRRGDGDDADSCGATSVTVNGDSVVTDALSDHEWSSCVVVDVDEMSDLSSSFDSLEDDPPGKIQNESPAPFQLLQRPDLICSPGSGTSLVVACDMLASRAGAPSHPGGIMTLNRAPGIVPNWLQSQLERLPTTTTSSLLNEWHHFVPVLGSCGFNNCRGSVLLLGSAGLGPSGRVIVE
jgi:hypothetical protein